MKMTISRKLMGCFSAMFLLTLVLAYFSDSTETTIQSVSDQATQRFARALAVMGEINTNLANARFAQRGIILYSMSKDAAEAEGQRARFQKSADGIRAGLTELRSLISDPARVESVDRLNSAFKDYTALAQEIAFSTGAGEFAQAMQTLKTKSKPIGAAMEKITIELTDYERAQMKESRVQVASAVSQGRGFSVLLVLVAVCLGTVVFLVLRKVTSALLGAARGIAGVSRQVHAEAEQICRGSNSLASGASQQAAALEQTSASSNQLSAITRKGAENTKTVAQTVEETGRKLRQAVQSLDQMFGAMKQRDVSASKIVKVIGVIDEIAFQTNILALNAAVEAARAGSAGTGFAVVADEVRSLAQRCAGAARETAEMIEASVASTQGGLLHAEAVTQLIRDISRDSATTKSLVDEVHTGSQEQAQGISQIARAIVEMESVTQKTAATAEESAAAGHEMFSQTGALKEMAHTLLDLVEVNP